MVKPQVLSFECHEHISGSDPNIDSPATEIHDGATEVRGNLERDPSLGRKHAVYDEMRAKGLTDYAALSWLKTIPRRGEAPQLCRDSGLAFARAGDFSNWRRPMNGMGMEFARVISPVESCDSAGAKDWSSSDETRRRFAPYPDGSIGVRSGRVERGDYRAKSEQVEWRVCDRRGTTIMSGFERTRQAANYAGDRALFGLLVPGWDER